MPITRPKLACAVAVAVTVLAAPALAQADKHDHGAHQPAPAAGAPTTEASKAYDAAMQKMHRDMSNGYTNDVDVDFVRGMIPHHQGAVEQAEVLLKYSKNPRLRRLAGGIIAAQRREMRFMIKWLREREQGIESAEMPSWLKDAPSTVEDAKTSGAKD